MTFVDAVKICLNKYVVFTGRARRSEYWYFVLFSIVVSIVAGVLDSILFGGSTGASPIRGLTALALFLPQLAVGIRRLHDVNRSGYLLLWFYALVVVVAAVVGISAFAFGSAGGLGGGLMGIVAAIGGLAILGYAVWLIILLVTPGTQGPNQYGEDPKGAAAGMAASANPAA